MSDGLPRTLGELHRFAREKLQQSGIADATRDARLIVEHFSNTTQTDEIARTGTVMETRVVISVDGALRRRVSGEPVHRILGFREFYGLRLALSTETLEPRPDTEILVDAVLPFIRQAVTSHGNCRILDLGTGSGAIALALLSQIPESFAVGIDLSEDALATASANAKTLALGQRFSTLRSDWFSNVTGRFHAIVSNPPYVRDDVIKTLQREVREFDPWLALSGGSDGLDAYRRIADGAAEHLAEGGVVAVEIGHDQGSSVAAVFSSHGWWLVEARKDLAGLYRVLVFRRES